MDRSKEVHVKEEDCRGKHCYACQVDENHHNSFQVCPACRHVFQTREEFLAEYLNVQVEDIQKSPESYNDGEVLTCPKCTHIWGEKC